MKNSVKFIFLIFIFICKQQSLYAQAIDLFNKNVKFEKILYKKTNFSKYIYYNVLEVRYDQTYNFEKNERNLVSNNYSIIERNTISKGSVDKQNFIHLLGYLKPLLARKVIFETIDATDSPKTKLCIYYDSKYDCYEYYTCPKELKELDKFLSDWH